MKKNVLLIVMVFIVLPSFSQINTFSKIYFNRFESISARSVVQTQDNGFITVGKLGNGGFFTKVDSVGNLIWLNSYKIPSWASITFNDIAPTSDSCYIITGNTPNPNSGTGDLVCLKINALGDTLWCKAVSGSGSHNGISIEETHDHGFIIAGLQDNINAVKISAVKLDSLGNLEWRRAMTFSNGFNIPVSIKQLPDSSYIILSTVTDNVPIVNGNAVLTNLSQSGDILWSKQYYRLTNEKFAAVDLLILSSGIISYATDNGYMTLMKTDFNGNVLFGKRYTSTDVNNCANCGNSKINPLSDGGYMITNGQPESNSNPELKILKLDSAFHVKWSKEVINSPIEVIESNDKGLLLLSGRPEYVHVGPYFGILKMDSLGWADSCVTSSLDSVFNVTIVSNSMNPITIDSNGVSYYFNPTLDNISIEVETKCTNYNEPWGINKEITASDIFISPNPFHESFNISSTKTISKIEIYTLDGKLIYTENRINDVQSKIYLENRGNQILILKVFDEDGNVTHSKIIQTQN